MDRFLQVRCQTLNYSQKDFKMVSNEDTELRETTLSPEVRRIRNSIIKKFANEPLDIMAKFVKDIVETEEDTVKRLGAMAARVEILRMRISQISDNRTDSNFIEMSEEVIEDDETVEDKPSEIIITSPNLSDWVRLRILENSEVNGVRFPQGVVIDVSQEDGDRLLESGKATYVAEDEIADVKANISMQKKLEQDQTKIDPEVLNEETQIEGSPKALEAVSISDPDMSILEEKGTDANKELDEAEIKADSVSESNKLKKKKSKNKNDEGLVVSEEAPKTNDLEPIAIEESSSPEDMLAGFDLDTDDTKK